MPQLLQHVGTQRSEDGGEVMRGFLRYMVRYFCARCAYNLLGAAIRRRTPKPAAQPCTHVAGALLSILALLTVVPLLAFGILGAFISK